MATQQQEQQPDQLDRRSKPRRILSRRSLVIIIVLFLAVAIIITWILSYLNVIPSFWASIFTIIITVLGAVFAFFQSMHLFIPAHKQESSEFPTQARASLYTPHAQSPSPQIAPIIPQVPTSQPLTLSSPPPDKTSYRGIVGLPPPTDPRTIQQREQIVKEVYSKLTQPDTTAIALTGIGGVGKSTLAALIYKHVEEQRQIHHCPFLTDALWLTIDPVVTFADLAGNLFEALEKPLPNLGNLAPQNQAVALFNALKGTDKPRLIILDQFENLLDWETGHALADRPGVGEWLDIINSQPCACRILLTSRPRPVGTREYPPTYLQEYPVRGLEVSEGIALLRNRNVQETEIELQAAVSYCQGHAFSLTLLASLIQEHHMSLMTLFKNSSLWIGDIATNLLDQIYTERLSDIQRELLRAFSVYREPVPLDATLSFINSPFVKSEVSSALKTLLTQHLLEADIEGRYHLHTIIADYGKNHFDKNSEKANEEALRAAYARAGTYYLQRAQTTCPSREKRRGVSDVHDLIEAIWQYCQAEQWKVAYGLMEQEKIFDDLKLWGDNAILLELYRLLLPLDKWRPEQSQAALIYSHLGRIYYALSSKEESLEYHNEALTIFSKSEDLHGKGVTLNYLGRVYNSVGRHKEALRCYEEALQVSNEEVNHVGKGRILNNIGRIYDTYGRKKEALKYFEEALEILRNAGDREGEGKILQSIGWVYDDMGLVEEAEKYFEMALQTQSEIGHRGEMGKILCNLGWVYGRQGKSEKAHRCFEEALSILKMVGNRSWEGIRLSYLGRMYASQENSEEALSCYTKALSILREVKDRTWEGITLSHLGMIYNSLGKIDQSLSCYTDAIHILRDVGDQWEEATTLHNIGVLYLEQRRNDIALSFILVSKHIMHDLEHPLLSETQKQIETLHKQIGDEQFTALLAAVEPQAQQIVDQVLSESKQFLG